MPEMTVKTIKPANPDLPELSVLNFRLPSELEAREPIEARGLRRDDVRLMVSNAGSDAIQHTSFRRLPEFLQAGDVLAINTSGTLNAALDARRTDDSLLEVHLSTHLPADLWVCEVLTQTERGMQTFRGMQAGERLSLPGCATLTLHVPYLHSRAALDEGQSRLWIGTLDLPMDWRNYLNEYGFPIRYSYVPEQWPLSYYQTAYATEPGSAEMPSAGRAFTPELITACVARGIQFAPLILHTGVASLEDHEPPYEEYYRVPPATAQIVNAARESGRRVIAVGTTVIRALETVADENGLTHPGEGWTNTIITAERGIRVADGLLTGLHEPRSTHLAMLQAIAGLPHLEITYAEALAQRYLWHEFGDLHLILP